MADVILSKFIFISKEQKLSVCLLKRCISFVLLVLTILMIFVAIKKPTELHEKEVKELNKERPLRHSERCDRTEAQCLSDKKGITVRGALKARQYGERFNNLFTEYVPYSSDTVRTKQTATYFSEKKPGFYQRCQIVMKVFIKP
ncbi:histidine phosphatase family protein [Escherichia coli]|uniref:histidine phosphatase family protein n=1 Tax=Escherichia coli TaxID=562 RepID=UPI001BD25D6E|nr:histidine phosphatase family protein [Escherichia coli]MBB9841818.1 histidine phosphatase family protein [Escherichia coli]MBS9329557.1 histidine phosphatase family protein [Escherichia coli]